MGVTRQQLQEQAVTALLENHNVIIEWGTGVGKSRAAIESIKALKTLWGMGKRHILLLVAETAHKKNWENEFTGALGTEAGLELFSSIVVECYASLPKYEWTRWDLIIADEAHHLRSENRTDIISTIHADYFLCLSATMSCKGDADDLMKTFELQQGEFTSLKFTIQDAIDNGILKQPRIFTHFLSLKDFTIRQQITEQWGKSAERKDVRCDYENRFIYLDRIRYPALNLTIDATPAQAYEYYTERMKRANADYLAARKKEGLLDSQPDNAKTSWAWNRYVQYGTKRKIVLGKSKTTFAKWLLSRLKDKKYICFCADVEQAEELGGGNAIHAGRKDSMDVINAFNNNEIRSLFAVNMIQEGQNLAGIQAGVVIQLGGKERQFVQKFGRALRSSYPEQHIIVIKGTRDDAYYMASVDGINKKYIKELYYGSLMDMSRDKAKNNVEAGNSGCYLPGLSKIATA